jgi:hypothetical protein
VRIGIPFLLKRQLDIATDGRSLVFKSTTVGSLHDPRAPACDRRETSLGDSFTEFPGLDVKWVIFLEAGRTENRDTGADEVKVSEAFDELPEYPPGKMQFIPPAFGAFKIDVGFRRYDAFLGGCFRSVFLVFPRCSFHT